MGLMVRGHGEEAALIIERELATMQVTVATKMVLLCITDGGRVLHANWVRLDDNYDPCNA